MSISARLTWWYLAILLLAMTVVVGTVYYEVFVEHPILRQRMEGYRETPAEELFEALAFAIIPVALLTCIGGGLLIRRTLSPLTRLAQAVEQIHADNLRKPLPRSGQRDEVDRLTEVFNALTARLDHSFQRVRDFTLHASHELKTPLTIMRAEVETALRDAPAGAHHQHYASLLEELDRLTQIVDGLNFLTRADAGLLQFEKAPVRLDELIQEACADARVLAEHRQITIGSTISAPVFVGGDRRRLRQLLLILTDNAIKYNHPGGTIEIRLQTSGPQAMFQITNSGGGIPPEQLERVFDRFFRGQEAQDRGIEGCGLGLSIARRIVEAHRGDIQIDSAREQTTVSVRLPLSTDLDVTTHLPSPLTRAA